MSIKYWIGGQALEEQVTVVSAISGKPMVGWRVSWQSADLGVVTSVTNYYGVAKNTFYPHHAWRSKRNRDSGGISSIQIQ
ncbi:hypothetical protein ACFS4T_27320 [Pseudomonas lini]